MPSFLCGDADELPNCCGIVEFGAFHLEWEPDYPNWADSVDEKLEFLKLGFARLACAAFVDTTVCKDAYSFLAKKFNIVYQSAPRVNPGSGRELFFVVYDGLKEN